MEGKVEITAKAFYYLCFSSIHDHANSHCFMKMLQGSLKETQYHWPNNKQRNVPLKEKFSTDYNTDDVAYINGKAMDLSIIAPHYHNDYGHFNTNLLYFIVV